MLYYFNPPGGAAAIAFQEGFSSIFRFSCYFVLKPLHDGVPILCEGGASAVGGGLLLQLAPPPWYPRSTPVVPPWYPSGLVGTTGIPRGYHAGTTGVAGRYHGGTTVVPREYQTAGVPRGYYGGTTGEARAAATARLHRAGASFAQYRHPVAQRFQHKMTRKSKNA